MSEQSKINRQYVSDLDKLLASIDKKSTKKTQSQLKEIQKHVRIAKLRDGASS